MRNATVQRNLSKMGFLLAAVALIYLVGYLTVCDGKTGYCICTTVNNSTMSNSWCRCQSTVQLAFSSESKISGTGNFSRYKSIENFAGLGLKDTTSAKDGRLIGRERIDLSSRVNWITITESGVTINLTEDGMDDYEDATRTSSDVYEIIINESIPTVLFNDERLSYKGEGIRSSKSYSQDDNKINNKYVAQNFEKEESYLSTFESNRIYARVTPASTWEVVLPNKAMAYKLSTSSDQYTGFAYSSRDGLIENSYLGSFNFRQNLLKRYKSNDTDFDYIYGGELHGWLSCCNPETALLSITLPLQISSIIDSV